MTQLRLGTVVAVALAHVLAHAAHAGVPVASTFTYQGELRDGGELVNGTLPMTFRLFDLPVGGVQIGGNFAIGAVQVVDGRFTVLLDFGAQFNTSAARFLEIEVDNVVLSPRQQLTAAPVSLFSQNTRGIVVDSQSDVSIGTTVGTEKFQVYTDNRARAIHALNLDQSIGAKYGVYASSIAETGYGVYGRHQATTGTRPGVYGTTDSGSANAVGVHGVVDTANAGSFSAAVRGENKGVGTTGIGVWGSQNGQGWGVYGSVVGGGNGARGVFGHSEGGGYGGYFENDNGVGVAVHGAPSDGTIAALLVQSAVGGAMLIDSNSINTTAGGGIFVGNENNHDIYLAAGGGSVYLENSSSNLSVLGDVIVGQEMQAGEVIAGYHFDTLAFTSQCQSDAGGAVTHLRMEAPFLVGSITSLNGNVSYNAFTGSHFATMDERVEAGTLVRMTGMNEVMQDDRPSEPVYGAVATYQANDPACLGAYVSQHDGVTTAAGAPVHLVAAVGNGFLTVVDDGRGAIEPGDLLISSDVQGCAMKDDAARFETSYVVARAAERVDWSSVEADAQGIKRRTISVLFDPTVRTDTAALRTQLAQQQLVIEDLQRRLKALEGK